MYGNGAAIGMEIIAVARRPILRVRHPALATFSVGAVGSPMQGAAEYRIAATTTLTIWASTCGCALPYRLLGIRLIS